MKKIVFLALISLFLFACGSGGSSGTGGTTSSAPSAPTGVTASEGDG